MLVDGFGALKVLQNPASGFMRSFNSSDLFYPFAASLRALSLVAGSWPLQALANAAWGSLECTAVETSSQRYIPLPQDTPAYV